MGSAVSKKGAQLDRKKKVENPQWKGWIRKAGYFNKGWKNRYFCLEGDRLYYFKNPVKTSKGCILLREATGICSLPYRPGTEAGHHSHVPLVISTPERLWMLAFDNEFQKEAFVEAATEWTDIEVCQVLLQDWVMFQMDSIHKRWKRSFMLYLSSGDILMFSDGSTTLLEHRIRICDIEKLHLEYEDGAAIGDGLISPRHQANVHLLAEKNIYMVLKNLSLLFEYDSVEQCERWKFVLSRASLGDVRGDSFTRRQKQSEARKKLVRQQRAEKLRRKQKQSKKKKNLEAQEMKDKSIIVSDVPSTSMNASSRSSRSSTIKKKKNISKFQDDSSVAEASPFQQVAQINEGYQDVAASNDSDQKIKSMHEHSREAWNEPCVVPKTSNIERVSHKRRESRRFVLDDAEMSLRSNIDYSHENSRKLNRKPFSLFKRPPSPSLADGIPLINISSPTSNDTFALSPSSNTFPRPRRDKSRSQDFEKRLVEAGFPDLYRDIKGDFLELRHKLEGKKCRLDLKNQVLTCEKTIDNLGRLIASNEGHGRQEFDRQGDWYTNEPPGGKYVRHWIHRKHQP